MFLAAFTSALQARPQAVHTKRAWLSLKDEASPGGGGDRLSGGSPLSISRPLFVVLLG